MAAATPTRPRAPSWCSTPCRRRSLWSFTNLVLAANSQLRRVMPDVTGTNYIQATDLSGRWLSRKSPTNGAILPLGTNVVVIAVADLYGKLRIPPIPHGAGSNAAGDHAERRQFVFSELGQVFTDPGVSARMSARGSAGHGERFGGRKCGGHEHADLHRR